MTHDDEHEADLLVALAAALFIEEGGSTLFDALHAGLVTARNEFYGANGITMWGWLASYRP